MQNFYKIIDNKAQVGSGTPPDETWVVYTVGEEPQDLAKALEAEAKEQELQAKLSEANQYLKDTDWVKSYLLEHKLGITLLPEDSYKFEIERIRNEKLEFIRANQ